MTKEIKSKGGKHFWHRLEKLRNLGAASETWKIWWLQKTFNNFFCFVQKNNSFRYCLFQGIDNSSNVERRTVNSKIYAIICLSEVFRELYKKVFVKNNFFVAWLQYQYQSFTSLWAGKFLSKTKNSLLILRTVRVWRKTT